MRSCRIGPLQLMMTDRMERDMTTITRTVSQFRSGNLGRMFADWRDQQIARFVGWVLSKRAVQQVIADQFRGETPMCRVMERAAEMAAQRSIQADDVEGLDRYIEDALNHLEIEAENVKGLDSEISNAVDQAFEDDDRVKAVVDNVCETIAERIRG